MIPRYHDSMLVAVFLAYTALLIHFARCGAVWRVPAFCCYLVAFLLSLIAHTAALSHPPGLGLLPYLEPALIGLKMAAALEAFDVATEDLAPLERRLMMLLLTAVILIAGTIGYGSQPDLYRSIRTYSNLGLAIGSVVAGGCLWIAPVKLEPAVRNHCLTLTLYFINLAVCGLLPAQTGTAWKGINLGYFTVSLLCCGMWFCSGLRSKPTFQKRLHVR